MSQKEPALVEVSYDAILHTTRAAILFKIDAHKDGQVWIPMSKIEEIKDFEPDDEGLPMKNGKITIPEWMAIEKGLV